MYSIFLRSLHLEDSLLIEILLIHHQIKGKYFVTRIDDELDVTELKFDVFKRKLQWGHNEEE